MSSVGAILDEAKGHQFGHLGRDVFQGEVKRRLLPWVRGQVHVSPMGDERLHHRVDVGPATDDGQVEGRPACLHIIVVVSNVQTGIVLYN